MAIKLEISTVEGHAENIVHYDVHSGNIRNSKCGIFIDLDLCKFENDLILNANNKNNKIYGSTRLHIFHLIKRNGRVIFIVIILNVSCWSERPIAVELVNLIWDVLEKLYNNIVNDMLCENLKLLMKIKKIHQNLNLKSKNHLLFLHSSKLHPQSCYIGRYIHTLHGLHDLLES
ncbi:hypothetical protein Glove_281g30 [Diversispora epigaea]|uniref:Uncharacterized protein n=1 Tax=Diversispora epigaea TaxID=1348612 RepID=A0A397I3B3_9GLOM|nr:hypothetical protein Glove_281g30 [Diversispora epigaea]